MTHQLTNDHQMIRECILSNNQHEFTFSQLSTEYYLSTIGKSYIWI